MFRLRHLVNQLRPRYNNRSLQSRYSSMSADNTAVDNHFNLIVIGGGSGGLGAAKRAIEYSTADNPIKVCVFEEKRYGGTCVNVGCVPKKIMWNTATIGEIVNKHARHYGFVFENESKDDNVAKFDLKSLKKKRDAYIVYLNNIYTKGLDSRGITHIEAHARFDGQTNDGKFKIKTGKLKKNKDGSQITKIKVKNTNGTSTIITEGHEFTADKVMVAVGGFPYIPQNVSGREYINTSDDFFNQLDYLPKKVAVVGAGYIAVELAQVLAGLGSETHLFVRYNHPLRNFDILIQKGVHDALLHSKVKLHTDSTITKITKMSNSNNNNNEQKQNDTNKNEDRGPFSLDVLSTKGLKENKEINHNNKTNKNDFEGFDYILYAIGRGPNATELGLDTLPDYNKIQQSDKPLHDKRNFFYCDEYEQTSIKNIYALGDVRKNGIFLTPVAIRAGRAWGDRIYGGKQDSRMDYENVPSVVFSHPPIGSIGLPEREVDKAIESGKFEGPKRVYEAHFRNLYWAMMPDDEKFRTSMKLICVGPTEKVVGLHMIGEGCDESLQGFGVAIKMGATKADFDSVVAIHPTGAEELVTFRDPRSSEHEFEHEKQSNGH